MSVKMPPGFEAKAVLGKGAMGIVYKAWQPKLQRHVAIKTCNIKESVAAGQDPARLEDEALTIARLNHPNIVALYDVLKDDENIYLIMELLEGPPVSRFLNRKSEPSKLGPLIDMLDLSFSRIFKDEAACEVGIAVARALDYGHSRKILHRDVKPANIVVTLDRHIKLLDFSIARDPHQSQEGRTVTGTVFGTVQYMSPEQILSNPLDGRTDVYALGCTLYHMVAGEVPFSDKNDITVCLNHVNDPPPDLLSLNPLARPELVEIILKCMEKKPEDRFDTAAAVADALDDLMGRIRKGVMVTPGADYDINLAVRGRDEDDEDEPPAIAFKKGKAEPPPPMPSSAANRRPSREFQRPREEESSTTREREKRRRDLSEIAAASDTKVPALGGAAAAPPPLPPPPAPRNDGRSSGSSSSAPWMGAAAAPAYVPPAQAAPPPPPANPSAFEDTPVPTTGRNTLFLFVVGGAVALLVLAVAAVVVMLKRGKSHAEAPDDTTVAVAISRTPSPEGPEATPYPTSTPKPTPTPVPTPDPGAAPLTVPDPPEVDPAIKKFRVDLDGGAPLWMVEVPPGAFVIGSPFDEPTRRADEGPRTRVVFTKPWFIGETEVTRAQWRAVMGERSIAGRGDLPVTDVSWEEATEFCRQLSERTGVKFALPTEAQWEYACRAGTASAFAFGEIVTSALANIDGTAPYPRTPASPSRGEATGAKELPPNAWGIFAMHGNAWEFARDAYADALPGRELTDPAPNARGEGIVLRGGGFLSGAADARSAARMKAGRTDRRRDGGLRLAAEL